MLTADFASAAVLITMGALLGKTSPLQLIVICLFEIVLFALNEWLGLSLLQVFTLPPCPRPSCCRYFTLPLMLQIFHPLLV